MSWSYSGNPGDSDKDQVRFLIGDTDTTDQQLSDEEILWAISEEGNVYFAAARCALALASKFARLVDKEVGDLSLDYSQRQKAYQDLADELSESATLRSATPYQGGQTHSDKRIDQDDPDNVQPAFQKGQFDYPGNKDETVRSRDPE